MSTADIINAIFSLCGGLGTFLIGIKLMSDSMETLADSSIKRLFGKISNNRFAGVGIGAAVTALIQASAITTVMVVGFVNAGMMSLFQATTVIMGANIGTTITAQIAALKDFDIMIYAMALALVGIFMVMMGKKEKVKTLGLLFGGLGLIFVGLRFTSNSMNIVKTAVSSSPAIENFIANLDSPILLLLIGALFTALIQSSSATTVIVISFASAGIAVGGGGNALLYIILGSNVGTCLTAMLSAIGVQTNAKRAALIHLLFNVFGAIIFFVLLICWPSFMSDTFVRWFPNAPSTQIAMFHTFFNTICTLLFLPFTGLFVKLSKLLIKDKKKLSPTQVSYLDERFVSTPSIALSQSIKEIGRMSQTCMEGLDTAVNAFLNRDTTKRGEVEQKFRETTQYNDRITDFLVKISSNVDTVRGEKEITSLHSVLSDIARISDLSLNIARYVERVKERNLDLSDAVNVEISDIYNVLCQMIEVAMNALEKGDKSLLAHLDTLENQTDEKRRTYSANHIKRLNDGACNPLSGGLYNNLLGNLERIGDHISFIGHSIEEY